MKTIAPLVVLLHCVCFADSVYQSNWSGGPGVLGPVFTWGNCYYASDGVSWQSGNPKLEFSATPNNLPGGFSFSRDLTCNDMDGDGDLDVVACFWDSPYTTHIVLWLNEDSQGTSWTVVPIDQVSGYGVWSIDACDIDGDGDNDIPSATHETSVLRWYENTDGTGTSWTSHQICYPYYDADAIRGVDMDEDGDIDLITGGNNDLSWWENQNGSGMQWTRHVVMSYFSIDRVCSVDADGDGDLDIAAASYWNGEIAVWRNNDGAGTSWTKFTIDGTFGCPTSIQFADIDGDGDQDALSSSYADNMISWWENTDGAGMIWTEHSVEMDYEGAGSAYPCDVDEDGSMDILGTSMGGDLVSCWLNLDGFGTEWLEQTISFGYDGSNVLGADIDGNGSIDIVASPRYGGQLIWWNMSGYAVSGWLESSILQVDDVSQWISYEASWMEPEGSSIGFQIRGSGNPEDMGAWSDTLSECSGSLSGIVPDSSEFIQYRVLLESASPWSTPVLDLIDLTFESLLGTGQTQESDSPWNAAFHINPCDASGALLQIQTNEPSVLEVQVFDLTGRIALRTFLYCSSESNSLNLNGLEEGVYFCRISGLGSEEVLRLTILR